MIDQKRAFEYWIVYILQGKIESVIQTKSRQIVNYFYRQLFCWMDHWYGLTMDDIRKLEEKTQKELEDLKLTGDLRGMTLQESQNGSGTNL